MLEMSVFCTQYGDRKGRGQTSSFEYCEADMNFFLAK